MKGLAKFVFLMVVFLLGYAKASCDPCICGPGGDCSGDIDDWFEQTCGLRTRRLTAVTAPAPYAGKLFCQLERQGANCLWVLKPSTHKTRDGENIFEFSNSCAGVEEP